MHFLKKYLKNNNIPNFCRKCLNINRTAYYKWLKSKNYREERILNILNEMIKIYRESKGIYGAKKIKMELEKQEIYISISTVSRYMSLLGIRSIVKSKFPKKYSKLREEEKKNLKNYVKTTELKTINQIWTTDITYIKTMEKKHYYLISFMDLYSRKIVAYEICKSQKAKDVLRVLEMAIKTRQPKAGLIIHSDKGSQFRSKEYRNFLSKNNFIASYTSIDHSCDENANQESFHALLKKECIYQNKIRDFENLEILTFECMSL